MPVIWEENGRGIELANLVVLCGTDVEVQPPVDVVVDVADARILYRREPEAWADGPIIVEASPADIPIPSRLLLAHQDRRSPLAAYRNAKDPRRNMVRTDT